MENSWHISPDEALMLHEDLYHLSEGDSVAKTDSKNSSTLKPILVCTQIEPNPEVAGFINKVMLAVNKTEADFEVVWDQDRIDESTKIILQFGTNSNDEPTYIAQKQSNYTICTFHNIESIMHDNTQKRMLWECLKTTFKKSQN